jgi:hypothetical protein
MTKLFSSFGVILEGTYTGIFSTGNSSVVLTANGAIPAIEAIVNNKYVNQNTSLTWSGIPDSTTAYLYVQCVETGIGTTSQQSTLQDKVCVAVWNQSGATPSDALFVGIAVTTGSGITLDTSTTASDNDVFSSGKPVYYSFMDHRTASPIDHPDLSVTNTKLADEAVLSRAIAPWDGTTSGTDEVGGKGIAGPHIKTDAIIERHILAGNVSRDKLADYAVLSRAIAPWDGYTSGTESYDGMGVASDHIKSDAVQARHIEARAVTDTKVGDDAIISRSISEWDGLSSGTDASDGRGVAGPHIKPHAVESRHLSIGQGFTASGPIWTDDVIHGDSGISTSGDVVSSGLDVVGTSILRRNVEMQAGFSGKFPLIRQYVAYVADPLIASEDNFIMPGFPNPTQVTEVMMVVRNAPTASAEIQFRNAGMGTGSGISVLFNNGENYASGIGDLSVGPLDFMSIYPVTLPSEMSGLSVYISGTMRIPVP